LFSKKKINGLYAEFRDDPKIKWKDDLKKLLEISSNEKAGMDE